MAFLLHGLFYGATRFILPFKIYLLCGWRVWTDGAAGRSNLLFSLLFSFLPCLHRGNRLPGGEAHSRHDRHGHMARQRVSGLRIVRACLNKPAPSTEKPGDFAVRERIGKTCCPCAWVAIHISSFLTLVPCRLLFSLSGLLAVREQNRLGKVRACGGRSERGRSLLSGKRGSFAVRGEDGRPGDDGQGGVSGQDGREEKVYTLPFAIFLENLAAFSLCIFRPRYWPRHDQKEATLLAASQRIKATI